MAVTVLLAGCVLVMFQRPATTAAAALVLAAVTMLAWRSGMSAAVDAVVLTDLLYLAVAVQLLGPWPLPGLVAVVTAGLLAHRSIRAPLWRSWVRRGRITPELPWLLASTVVVTVIALVTWQRIFDGELPQPYRDVVLDRPLWLIAVAGASFSLVNAAVEEAIFRGVLQTALEQVSGPAVAITVQTAAFGVLHLVGIPTGVVGAVMAGVWGVLLGVLRRRTRGILAPYAAHVIADTTIFLMLLPTLT